MEFLPFTRPTIDEESIEIVNKVLRSGWLATGPNVTQLENDLATYLGYTNGKEIFVKLLTSATGALEIALRAMGVGEGDEVIVPAMSFAASANVVMLCGATLKFVDVDLATRNMNVKSIEHLISKKTKVIMPVHFAGLAVEMQPLLDLAKKNNIRVLEDAAHAIGSYYQGKKIGSFGDVISFSFHPNKNMTTIEGGALILKNKEEAQAVDLYRFHGLKKDAFGSMDVLMPSGKFNMPDVNAALGISQLKQLDDFCQKRRNLAHYYFELLKNTASILLPEKGDQGHSWHIFAPLIDFNQLKTTRPEFIKKMAEKNIGVGVHYPAMHLFTAFKKLGYRQGDFPNAEKIGEQTVTLPLFPTMTTKDVERVCETLKVVLGLA